MFVAIFNKMSTYFFAIGLSLVALLLVADASTSCLMAIQKIVFLFRGGTLDVR